MAVTVSTSWAIALAWAAFTSTPEVQVRRVHCIAENAWFEAGNLADAELISHVVVNRSREEAVYKDVCAVIRKPEQFSWTRERGKVQRGPQPRTRDEVMYFMNLLSLSWNILHTDTTDVSSLPYSLTNFHSYAVKPNWKGLCIALRGEYHVFYRPCAQEPNTDDVAPAASVSPSAGAGPAARGSLTPRGAPAGPPIPQRKPGR